MNGERPPASVPVIWIDDIEFDTDKLANILNRMTTDLNSCQPGGSVHDALRGSRNARRSIPIETKESAAGSGTMAAPVRVKGVKLKDSC